jgi:hypothetical protein
VKVRGKPYDLELTRPDGDQLTVEVKGTTSDGVQLALTEGEVRHHRDAYPHNALLIVRRIELRRGARPKATGGEPYTVPPSIYAP